jgi:hypothetical protein
VTDSRGPLEPSGARGKPPPGAERDTVRDLLVFVAGRFSADPVSLLAEWNSALRLRDALHRGYRVERGNVTRPSAAAMASAAAMEEAARHCLAKRAAARSPNDLPADLEVADTEVGADLQMSALSEQDDSITLQEAALLLDLRSGERVRQLIQAGLIEGWQSGTGRRKWYASRASVVAYFDGSGHGSGGTARVSA